MPLPLVSYEGEHVYARGLGAGLYLWKQGAHALSVGASYMPMSFTPGDSDDWRRGTFLSSEIKNSPMVDKSALFSSMLGVNYTF